MRIVAPFLVAYFSSLEKLPSEKGEGHIFCALGVKGRRAAGAVHP